MKKLVFVLLAVICFVNFTGSAHAATLIKGDVVYARSNLRADGCKIFYHNMCALGELVPVGTEVKIKESTSREIAFVTTDINKTYYIYADSAQWGKYFVKDKNEIGLDKFSPDVRAKVMNCEVANGMTKEEVYASKGCPAFSAWGYKTEKSSLADIMESNKWYYLVTSRGHDVMVTFENGVVTKTGGFEK